VRADVVVLVDKGVEGRLLRRLVFSWRSACLRLQRAVHALVPTVLLRLTGRDEVRANTKLDEPHREAREAADARGAGAALKQDRSPL
jgi:hypothetical protein